MSDLAVNVTDLTKSYRIGVRVERYQTLRDTIANGIARAARFRRQESSASLFWALQGVSLEIKCGDVLGLIGRNGAGKTTLLKILSRITEPTSGTAEIWGRVGSLLEVGTGFHQELTGRENIYLNGAILGMGRGEIRRKLDDIVAFAEVEKFLDTPVKRFSSGMYLRLAFAVAAHLEPEILMVDEVLAVGDVSFQNKCLGKMSEVAQQDRTILFVSHNMAAISQLCKRVVWLDEGKIRMIGQPAEVIAKYLSSEVATAPRWENESPSADHALSIESAAVLGLDDRPRSLVDFSGSFRIEVKYRTRETLRDLSILCRVTDPVGNIVWTSWDTDTSDRNGQIREPGYYRSTCAVPATSLRPGRYFLTVGAVLGDVRLAFHDHILTFDVSPVGFCMNMGRQGVVTPILDWSIESLSEKQTLAREVTTT